MVSPRLPASNTVFLSFPFSLLLSVGSLSACRRGPVARLAYHSKPDHYLSNSVADRLSDTVCSCSVKQCDFVLRLRIIQEPCPASLLFSPRRASPSPAFRPGFLSVPSQELLGHHLPPILIHLIIIHSKLSVSTSGPRPRLHFTYSWQDRSEQNAREYYVLF